MQPIFDESRGHAEPLAEIDQQPFDAAVGRFVFRRTGLALAGIEQSKAERHRVADQLRAEEVRVGPEALP